MIDVAKLISERKRYLETLKPPIRHLDAEVKDLTRELNRLLARKKALPDEDDLLRIAKMLREVKNAMDEATAIVGRGYAQ